MADARSPAPFIVGVSRSGTTLLRLMLDAHRDLAIPAETHFVTDFARRRLRPLSRDGFLAVVTGAQTWPNFGLEEAILREAVDALDPFSVSAGVRCFYELYAKRFGKERWGDKTPRYGAYLPFIGKLLPEAHFVHVIRDGRDVATSLRGLWWGPGEDVGAQARFWVEEIERTRRLSQRVAHYTEVRFEALVSDPEGTLKSLCRYLALSYEAGMLAYHEQAAERLAEYRSPFGDPARTPEIARFISVHEHVTQPPDRARIGRWSRAMTGDEVRRYEAVAGPLLRELGYVTRS